MSEPIKSLWKQETPNYTVELFSVLRTGEVRGYFEHNTLGDERGGELLFDTTPEGKYELTDYDGVPVLPREVREVLISKGIIVDEVFY